MMTTPKSRGWLVSIRTFFCVESRRCLLLAFSQDTAMCAGTRDCVHVHARQLPDYQLQMHDWDRHPSPTVPTACPPGLHTLSLTYSLAPAAALFVLRQKGQHYMHYRGCISVNSDFGGEVITLPLNVRIVEPKRLVNLSNSALFEFNFKKVIFQALASTP